MSTAFNPKSCNPDQWKTWLRDAGRLYLRAFLGWGLLWVLLYFSLGWCMRQQPLLFVIIAGASGIFQLCHLAVMKRVMTGRVGMADLFSTIGALLRDQRALLIQSVLVRTGVCLGMVLLLIAMNALITFLHGATGTQAVITPPPAPHGWWEQLMAASAPLFNSVIFPLLIQLGGSVSVVLSLLSDGVEIKMARNLDGLATVRNRQGVVLLSFVFLLTITACVWFSPLVPFVVVYWMAVIQCFYADVFKGGYAIEALARAPSKARPAVAFATAA